jgi:hypothetical protein
MSLAARRVSLRTCVLLASGALTLVAATGIVETKAFAEPTTLKYGLTVAAPLAVFIAAMLDEPLYAFAALTIVAAPFAGATAQLGSIRVSLVVPLLLVDFGLIAISRPITGAPPSLRWAALATFPLLLLPILDSSESRELTLSLLLMIAVAVVIRYTARTERGLYVVLGSLAFQVALQSAIAIWNAKTGRTLNLYSSAGTTQYAANYIYKFDGVTRPTGTLPDPISLANILAFSVPTNVVLLFSVRPRWARLAVLVSLGLVVAALVLTLDRTSWIGCVAGLVVAVALLPAARRGAVAWRVAAGFVLVAALALVIGGSATSGKLKSIIHPTSVQGATAQAKGAALGEQDRLSYWRIALVDGFVDHPVAGVGIGNGGQTILDHSSSTGAGVRAATGQYANVASTYLQLLAEGGLCALALFVVVFICLSRDLRAALKVHPVLASGLAGAVVTLLICWVTDVVVYYEAVAACEGVLFGVVAAAASREPDSNGSARGK